MKEAPRYSHLLPPGKVAPVVREKVRVAEAAGNGLPVLTYAPDSAGTSDYRDVAC
jgi:cellulose biosynthesis protein BcsQ